MDFDVTVIGAGASGTACAAAASQRGLKTAVLEHCSQGLNKVRVSGGGRCNFTNLNINADCYVSQNPKFSISALRQFSQFDFIEMVKNAGIDFYEKTAGQLFCKTSSDEIIRMLCKNARQADFFYDTKITDISHEDNIFTVKTSKGTFISRALVVATGGASFPNLGASETGYKIAKQFGIKIVPYKPALVPLNLDSALMKQILPLKGIALNAEVRTGKFCIRENILFTHFGISGPAVLQASLYWNKGEDITINFLPDIDIRQHLLDAKAAFPQKKTGTVLKAFFPDKFIDFLLSGQDKVLGETSNKALELLSEKICRYKIRPTGTQGFQRAEVTAGGVDTKELSSQTFETKKIRGLYFIGEVLDITGRLGGYNLQWAWSSGFTAGKHILEKENK